MDLLSPESIKEIFDSIIDQAVLNGMRLLTQHPSDLFQMKVYYYVHPDSVKLFIHIPMALVDSLLWLHMLHPFQLHFMDNHSLLLDLDNSLLSLSCRSQTRLHNELSPATLAGCQKAS